MNTRILPLFALVLAILIFFGYVNPLWTGTIVTAKTAIAGYAHALEAAEAYKAKENQLASARDAIPVEDLELLSTFLPDSVDNVALILDLNALAARSGLALSDIDVSSSASDSGKNQPQTAPVSPVGSIELSLSASGTFTALRTFLTGVEHSGRLLDVVRLTVKGSDTGVYTYQMNIRLYWLR